MCTKTKTTWGCGCSTKDNEPDPCQTAKRLRSFCSDYKRYHFTRDIDCLDCRDGRDPMGRRGMRGEDLYSHGIRGERRREDPRKAYDDSYDRGRTPQPKGRAQRPSYKGGTKANPNATDDDGPESIVYEYSWDSPSAYGRRTEDEDVDDVIDLTPPEAESRDRRHRGGRRSSFPPDYGSPAGFGRAGYERAEDRYYRNKGPARHDERHRARRNSLDDEATDSPFGFVRRMREHFRPGPKGKGRVSYGYRDSRRHGDLDDFSLDYDFDDDDFDFDYELSPRRGPAGMGAGFPKFPKFPKFPSGFDEPEPFYRRRRDDFY